MKNKEKVIGSIVILLLISIFLFVGYFISKPKKKNSSDIFVESTEIEKSNDSNSVKSNVKENKLLCVQITGAVNKPGVYYLQFDSRVKDLINEAGGFTKEADIDKVKLVQKLSDSDWVYISKIGETISANAAVSTFNSSGNGGLVNLNTATMDQLNDLPGIGETLAKRIYDYRQLHGSFNSIEDLKKVGGIGDGIINKFKDLVEIR